MSPLLAGRFFTTQSPGKPILYTWNLLKDDLCSHHTHRLLCDVMNVLINLTVAIFLQCICTVTFGSVQFSSVAQSRPTLCDPMNRSTPGLPVYHQFPESTQTHVHWVSDAIQPSPPLSSPSPPAFNLSQHQGLFKWVSSLHQVTKVLEFKLQHQSCQWTPRPDLL